MDYSQLEPQSTPAANNNKKWLLIGGLVLAVLVVIGIGFLIYIKRSRVLSPVPVAETSNNQAPTNDNANVPSAPPLPANNGAYYDVEPGLNRPLTDEEKTKYQFPTSANVWIKTTSPTDGSKPDVYFFQGSSGN